MSGGLFGIVPAGLPPLAEPSSRPSETSFLYTLPADRPFSHIVVFLLPGAVLPPDTAAAIYLATGPEVEAAMVNGAAPDFKFLGGIGPGKESAVFRISDQARAAAPLVLGISVEEAASVRIRIQECAGAGNTPATISDSSSRDYRAMLAQKIIKDAFTFLASFSGSAGPGQVEVVPLKAFEDWWRRFEGRLRSDPTFLGRDSA